MAIKYSVVIPNYNGQELLAKHLPVVIKACQKWRSTGWEVIVVDDASTDNSVDFLKKEFSKVKVVVNPQNLRFAETCNRGVKAAKGQVIVLLNNDVSPEINFLKPLAKHFKKSDLFAVGLKEKDKTSGKTIYSGRSQGKFEKGFLVHWRAKDQNRPDTLWANGGNLAADRRKWLELGGFDRLFRPGYWEDIDLSWRAREKGWEVVFEPQSVVDHHHETTNIKEFGRSKMNKFATKNQFLFVWKNGDWKMRLSHLFWLPYHLIRALLNRDLVFWQGFFLALLQLPELVINRVEST